MSGNAGYNLPSKNKNKNKPRKQAKGMMTLRLLGLKVEPLPPTLAHLPCWTPYPCPQLPVGHLESCLLHLSLFPGLLALGTAPAQSFRWESPRHLGGTL